MPDSHVDSPHVQTSPGDAPPLGSLPPSGPILEVPPAPAHQPPFSGAGPSESMHSALGSQQPLSGLGLSAHLPSAPGAAPSHSIPFPHEVRPSGSMPSAPAAAMEAQASSMQQLQAALSAQSQVLKLCCAVLCCDVLCCAVLCCAVLCCAVLCHALHLMSFLYRHHVCSCAASSIVLGNPCCIHPSRHLQNSRLVGCVSLFIIHQMHRSHINLAQDCKLWLQGNVLPAGLDLGSISALAAALGVQGVALPGNKPMSPRGALVLLTCHVFLSTNSDTLLLSVLGIRTGLREEENKGRVQDEEARAALVLLLFFWSSSSLSSGLIPKACSIFAHLMYICVAHFSL